MRKKRAKIIREQVLNEGLDVNIPHTLYRNKQTGELSYHPKTFRRRYKEAKRQWTINKKVVG